MSRVDLVSKNLPGIFFDVTVKHFPNDSALSCKIAKFYISPSFIKTVILNNILMDLEGFR